MRMKWVSLAAVIVCALGGTAAYLLLRQPAKQSGGDIVLRDYSPPLSIEQPQETFTAEHGSESQSEFHFENQRNHPVTVGIEVKACKCARVEMCLSPVEWKTLDAAERHKREQEPNVPWQVLEQGGPGFTVPEKATGRIRLRWKANVAGDQRYWAGLWIDDHGYRHYQRIEIEAKVLLPVLVGTEDQPKRALADLGCLKTGEERTVRFLCYSPTREHFQLTAAPPEADPFLHYNAPEPLTAPELKALADKLRTSVRSGFRVSVTLRERAGDALHDLGAFRHLLIWKTDVLPGHQVSAFVQGSVEGEVKLTSPKGKSFVNLGRVEPRKPAAAIFTVESSDPTLELTLDPDNTLDIVTAELLDGKEGKPVGGGKSWRVRVQYRTESGFYGRFPVRERPGYDSDAACSVVFQMWKRPQAGGTSQPVRRLRVPVHGEVRQSN